MAGLIERLAGGVVEQRLGDAGSLELLREISIQFFARQPFQVILHGNALAQRLMHLQLERAAQQRLTHQQQRQIVRGVHVEVQQQGKLLQRRVAQQLGLVADEQGVLFLALIQAHDSLRDLARQVAAIVRRLQIQFQRHLAEQIERRARRPVQIHHLEQIGIQTGGEAARRGALARTDFAGDQPRAAMLYQKLEPRLDLIPGLGSKQLFAIRVVAERCFLEAEEGFYHGTSSSSLSGLISGLLWWTNSTKLMPVGWGAGGDAGWGEGNWPLTTASSGRAEACSLPSHQTSTGPPSWTGSKRTSTMRPAR